MGELEQLIDNQVNENQAKQEEQATAEDGCSAQPLLIVRLFENNGP